MTVTTQVKVPREIELEDNTRLLVPEDDIYSLNIACLTHSYRNLIRVLRDLGFKPAPAVPLGEVVSLSRPVTKYLELHVRVFRQGLVLSEIEISRIYLEHFMYRPVNGAYYLYELLRGEGFEDIHLLYKGRLVREVLSFYDCEIVVQDNLHRIGDIMHTLISTIRSVIRDNVVRSVNVLRELVFLQQ